MNLRKILRWILPKPLRETLRSCRSRVRMWRIGVRRLVKMPGVTYLGSVYGGYAVPVELVRGRTGLCFGAGEDISFEVRLASEFGATVHIYDPTPRAIEYCRGVVSEVDAKGDGKLFIHPYGVWSECKTERFYAPSNPEHVSHSIVNLQDTSEHFDAECLSPEEILNRLGLEKLTFVKLNIEGAEYEVMKAMFERDIKPDVVCITFDELHSALDGKATDRLRGLIRRFRAENYVPVHVVDCKGTFVRRNCNGATGADPFLGFALRE